MPNKENEKNWEQVFCISKDIAGLICNRLRNIFTLRTDLQIGTVVPNLAGVHKILIKR